MKVIKVFFLLVTSALILNGCSSNKSVDYDKASGGGRYSILQDHAPTGDIKVDNIPDLVPKWEPKSRGGNKSSYEVWGKKYWVMDSAQGYTAQGTASWYGNKFHGHKTSNGEIYDMYSFSAAHKSLPLPTYLKVTNLENQKTVIVRVNDRGPFHGDRLIDLSYAAAARLGYHKKGLARVKIEAITPAKGEVYSSSSSKSFVPQTVKKTNVVSNVALDTKLTHLQLGAFSLSESAERLKNRLFEVFDTGVNVLINQNSSGLYKVLIGPYDNYELGEWQSRLQQEGFGQSILVVSP